MTLLTDDPLRTVDELAAFLHTTPQGVYAMEHRGLTPRSIRVGRRRLYPESEIRTWLAARIKADS